MMRSTRLLTFALAAMMTASLFAKDNVAALAETYDSLRVGASTTAAGLVIRQGNAEFTLASGSVAPVLAGDQTVGLFFKGRGSYNYRITDKDELAVATSNVKRASSLALDAKDAAATVSDSFDQAFFWIAGTAMPQLGAAGGDSLAAAYEEHRKFMANDLTTTPVHQYIQQRLDAPKKPLVRAELTGGKENAVYVYDEADRAMESLYVLQRVGGTDRQISKLLYAIPISEHPIGWSRRKPQAPRFTLSAIDYTLVASGGKDAALSIAETFTGSREGLTVLRLDLYDVMYVENGIRRVRVKSATDDKGNLLPIDHRNGQLLVGLTAPLAPNATTTVKFEIEGDFLVRPSGDSFWQLGIEPWFPQPDLGEQYYTVHSVVKVKKPFVPFAPGKTVKRGEEGDYNVVENVIDKPVQFAVAQAGKYYSEEETRNGVTVRVATYAGKNTRAIKQLTNLAFGIMEYYEFFLGPFPFPELNIIEMNTWGSGQAPPGTMFITKEAFNPTLGEVNQIFSQGINERFAHEIAHQYWGHVVKMPSGEEQWLTESFAEYSAALFLKKLKKDGTYESLIRHWQKNASDASRYSSIATANRIRIPGDGMQQMMARTGLLYDKGAYLLAALHKELGDQVFLSFLKSYQKSFRWKFGSTDTVGGLLQFITKKDYTPFLDEYYWGTKMPPAIK